MCSKCNKERDCSCNEPVKCGCNFTLELLCSTYTGSKLEPLNIEA